MPSTALQLNCSSTVSLQPERPVTDLGEVNGFRGMVVDSDVPAGMIGWHISLLYIQKVNPNSLLARGIGWDPYNRVRAHYTVLASTGGVLVSVPLEYAIIEGEDRDVLDWDMRLALSLLGRVMIVGARCPAAPPVVPCTKPAVRA